MIRRTTGRKIRAGWAAVALAAAGLAALPAGASPMDAIDAANEAADDFVGKPDRIIVERTDSVAASVPRTEAGGAALYDDGDYQAALTVWREAADAGDAGAAFRAGHLLVEAEGGAYAGVAGDTTAGRALLLDAEAEGEARAMYWLGAYHFTGAFGGQDLSAAYTHLYLADQYGYSSASDSISLADVAAAGLTDEEIEAAIAAADALRPAAD